MSNVYSKKKNTKDFTSRADVNGQVEGRMAFTKIIHLDVKTARGRLWDPLEKLLLDLGQREPQLTPHFTPHHLA